MERRGLGESRGTSLSIGEASSVKSFSCLNNVAVNRLWRDLTKIVDNVHRY